MGDLTALRGFIPTSLRFLNDAEFTHGNDGQCNWHVWGCSCVPWCSNPSGFGTWGKILEQPLHAGTGVWTVSGIWVWCWACSAHRSRCLKSWWRRAAQLGDNPALVSPSPAQTDGTALHPTVPGDKPLVLAPRWLLLLPCQSAANRWLKRGLHCANTCIWLLRGRIWKCRKTLWNYIPVHTQIKQRHIWLDGHLHINCHLIVLITRIHRCAVAQTGFAHGYQVSALFCSKDSFKSIWIIGSSLARPWLRSTTVPDMARKTFRGDFPASVLSHSDFIPSGLQAFPSFPGHKYLSCLRETFGAVRY